MTPDHHELSVVCQLCPKSLVHKKVNLCSPWGLIHMQSRVPSHVLTANKPADWPLFFSFALAAAAAFWVLFCS